MQISSLWPGPAKLGECPVWHPLSQILYWVDCKQGLVYAYAPTTQEVTTYRLPAPLGCVVPAAAGNLLAFAAGKVLRLEVATGTTETLQEVYAEDTGLRANDGKCDRQGRFWFGTVSSDFAEPVGCLYRYDVSTGLQVMAEGLYISNGLGWSPDNKYMYHCDSYIGKIYRHTFDAATGNIGPREIWLDYPGLGVPDGLTVDARGYVWTGVWDGGKVLCIDPAGKVCQEILLPVQRATSCMFGQSDYATLFVTSCSEDVGEDTPLASPNGGLYAIGGITSTSGEQVVGLPEGVFAVGVAKD